MPNNFPYTLDIPFATNNPSADQPDMQTNTDSISKLLAVDHVGFNTNGSGIHQQIRMNAQPAPGVGDGTGDMYANTLTGNTWPYWQNGAGNAFLMVGPSVAANNGYTYLPGGLLLQWGTLPAPVVNNASVLFATANINFPNNCFNVSTQLLGAAFTNANPNFIGIVTGSVSVTGFSLHYASNSAGNNGMYWTAIGN